MILTKEQDQEIYSYQRGEITEHKIYSYLAQHIRQPANKKILEHIAGDELKHYFFWKKYTRKDAFPRFFQFWGYALLSRIFGLTFSLKLMERGEGKAQHNYARLSKLIPESKSMLKDEAKHEKYLISLLEEEKLKYVSSIVLGLNDALVELTGALAGLTLALQNRNLIVISGLIIGIAASLSMAASEYLSKRSENPSAKNSLRASIYTGMAYLLTVLILVLPYFILKNVYLALGFTLINSLLVIFFFTYYTSVAQELPFGKRFGEMAGISLGVAAITFGISFLVKMVLGVSV